MLAFACQPEEGIGSSGAGAVGNCEALDVGAGNGTQALCKSSEHFMSLQLLESLIKLSTEC